MSNLTKIITDLYPNHSLVRLGIGQGGIFVKPTIVSTVLGSCVSVTFYCSNKKMGALFHALLPKMPADASIRQQMKDQYRFVDSSVRHIVHSLNRRGIRKDQLEVKVFGGAEAVFKGVIRTGASNIMAAYEALSEHNMRIKSSDIGGNTGRSLVFVSSTGEVFIKNHKNNLSTGKRTLEEEQEFRKLLN